MKIAQGVIGVIFVAVSAWFFSDTWAKYWPSDLQDDGSIRFAHFGNYQDYQLWCDTIEQFEQLHAGVKVKQEYVVGLSAHYNTKLRQQMLTDTLPDVALVQLAAFHELGYAFADLSDLSNKDSLSSTLPSAVLDPVAMSAFQLAGVQRGLPVSGGNLLIYLNLDCLEQANQSKGVASGRIGWSMPTENWRMADFRAFAAHLTCDFDGDGITDQFGFWLPRWIYYLPFLWSFDAELTDESMTHWKLIGSHAKAAIEFYRSLVAQDRSCPRDFEVPQLFQDTAFLTGRVAMCVNGPWFLPMLKEADFVDRVAVLSIPHGSSGKRSTRITWDGIVVRKNLTPARRQRAWAFVKYVLSATVQDRIASSGRALPARIASMESFTSQGRTTLRQPFVDAVSYSRLQPIISHFTRVDQAINKMLYRLSTSPSQQSVSQYLTELADDPTITSVFNKR